MSGLASFKTFQKDSAVFTWLCSAAIIAASLKAIYLKLHFLASLLTATDFNAWIWLRSIPCTWINQWSNEKELTDLAIFVTEIERPAAIFKPANLLIKVNSTLWSNGFSISLPALGFLCPLHYVRRKEICY